MLSNGQLTLLCQTLRLSPQAQAVIENIRSSPPARRVRSAAGNVSVRYASRKMGFTIQAESHRNELPGVYEKEHDPETLEYYDQPPPIKLVYRARNGKSVGVLHTPDYFVIRTDSVGWEEWKTEEELLRLAEKMPNRFVRGEDGRWRCPPGEHHAEPLGFFYRLHSSAEIDWIFQRNLLFIEDYLRDGGPPVGERAAQAVLTLATVQPGLRLKELLNQVADVSSDDVYTLIAAERLFVDLRAAPLAEPERVQVYRDEETARAYARMAGTTRQSPIGGSHNLSLTVGSPVVWDGRRWTIVNPGPTTTALLTEDGALIEMPSPIFKALASQGKLTGIAEQTPPEISKEAREFLLQANPDDFREANRRYTIIAAHLSGSGTAESSTPARTVRHHLAKWREAELIHHCGYVGLLPRHGQKGNRKRKLPESSLLLLDQFIAAEYETLKQKGKLQVYGALVRACEASGLSTPSYKTFTQAVNRRPRQAQVAKRRGPRAAYQESSFYWELTLTTPRHGDRPFEIGHLDHTQLDVELVCSRTGRNLGRPWATFLSDAFSRRLLAVYLTFDRPSYRSCMMALRECVRRHSRLPQILVVDGGAEFGGVYFETLLARYECSKKTRPGAQPRFGSVCERLFGTTNTRFIHNLAGNTQLLQNVRQVTKAVDPKGQARWTLDRLCARLTEWAYEIYDTIEHPALGQSPREAFAAGLVQGGQRPQRLIPYDEGFQMFTLPTTSRGTARLQRRLGVKIHYLYYWAEAFLDPELEKTELPVRFDPFDVGIAYAFVRGRWRRCISEHYARFAGRSEREIQLASAELRRQHQRQARQLIITARKLADFLASVEAEEVLLEQRLRDAAIKDVQATIEGGRVGESDAGGGSGSEKRGAREVERSGAAPKPHTDAEGAQGRDTLVIYEDY